MKMNQPAKKPRVEISGCATTMPTNQFSQVNAGLKLCAIRVDKHQKLRENFAAQKYDNGFSLLSIYSAILFHRSAPKCKDLKKNVHDVIMNLLRVKIKSFRKIFIFFLIFPIMNNKLGCSVIGLNVARVQPKIYLDFNFSTKFSIE